MIVRKKAKYIRIRKKKLTMNGKEFIIVNILDKTKEVESNQIHIQNEEDLGRIEMTIL